MSIVGNWIQDGHFDNMEALLDAVGLTDPSMRGMIINLKVELEVAQNGDQWEFKMIAPHATRVMNFKNGDEVDQVSIVGRPVKSVMTIEGNTMTEVHKNPNNEGENTHISRTVNGDVMEVTLQNKDIKCIGKYKRA